MKIEFLFSPTGDTVLTFGGGITPTLNFIVVKRLNDTLDFFDGFQINSTKNKLTKEDYPPEFLKKYNLTISDTLIDINNTNDITITQKVLQHKKISKSNLTPYYIYKVVLSISIKICGKNILENYKVNRQYEGPEKENDINVKFNNSDIIGRLVKMSGKKVYFFYIHIFESYFDENKKVKHTKLKYDNGQIINCH